MTEDRRLAPIRQLSLQQTTSSRQKIVRHRSADDEKSLQVYNHAARGKLIGNGKTLNRPKVRIAWGETNRKAEKQLEKVEVVAHQIPGKLKANSGRYRAFSGNEKASILFSRQQLAERLRLAWKHREENKGNIDIVLAHNVHEDSCDLSSQGTLSAPSTPSQEKATSDMCNASFTEDFHGKRNEENLNDQLEGEIEDKDLREEECKLEEVLGNTNENIGGDLCSVNQKRIVESNDSVNADGESVVSCLQEISSAKQKRANFRSGTNKAFLSITKSTEDKQKAGINNASQSSKVILKNDRNVSIEKNELDVIQSKCYNDDSSERTLKPVLSKSHSKNDMKFRDVSTIENESQEIGNNLMNASQKIPQENKDSSQIDKIKMIKVGQSLKPNQYGKTITPRRNQSVQDIDQRSRRTNSAPPQRNLGCASSGNRVQVNIVIDTPSTTKSSEKNLINCQNSMECHETSTRIERFDSTLSKVSFNRPTRSAPLKRRSRSTKRRLFAGVSKADSDTNHSGNRRNGVDTKTIDVVTMVSLVSSADSDSDIENSPGDDNLINELRSKLPTTPIIKASINTVVPRRPIKSVSFQGESFDEDAPVEQQIPLKEEKRSNHTRFGITNNREKGDMPVSCNDSIPKQETTGLVLPLLTFPHDTDHLSEVQLTDREKRCLAVPIGDLHDKKRKLLKTRSTPTRSTLERQAVSIEPKERDLPNNVPRMRALTNVVPLLPDKTPPNTLSAQSEQTIITGDKASEEVQIVMCEPHFQTPKEKECWQLYRRMCDKGVCVSFDTVLRGMLTPTEYRLRQKDTTA